MVGQGVKRRVGRGHHFDVELIVKRSRTEGWRSQLGADGVVILTGVAARKTLFEPEQLLESVVEPHARGRAAEKVIGLGEANPYSACLIPIHLLLPNAQVFHGGALAVEHAEDVVIGNDEEAGGIGKCFVFCEPARFGVPVRTDDS
jgi:hypothetical protein